MRLEMGASGHSQTIPLCLCAFSSSVAFSHGAANSRRSSLSPFLSTDLHDSRCSWNMFSTCASFFPFCTLRFSVAQDYNPKGKITDEGDIAICVEPAEHQVRFGVLELLIADIEGRLESPRGLADPCTKSVSHINIRDPLRHVELIFQFRKPFSRDQPRQVSFHSHCTSHSFIPLNGSAILPCFMSSTWTEVGTLLHPVHSVLAFGICFEASWANCHPSLRSIDVGMVTSVLAVWYCTDQDRW